MAKNTQAFVLFNMLKAAGPNGVSKTEVANVLSIKESSVPVYFFGLKKQFNAEIETVKKGREIIAYKLVNADTIAVPQHRSKNKKKLFNKKVAKTTDAETPILDTDLMNAEIGENEFNDIKAQLGLY